MATKAKSHLTVEQYLAQYEGAEGRYELVRGEVVKMASETAQHVRLKFFVAIALKNSISKAGLPCEVFTDGMTVKINRDTGREPDAAVQCGKKVDPNSLLLDSPVIVVEVISPSSEISDTQDKLADYFSVPSIQHYIIVKPEEHYVLHHKRLEDDKVLTAIVRSGQLVFDPPGIVISMEDIFGEVDQ
jgi:Uma2 family endonuclease